MHALWLLDLKDFQNAVDEFQKTKLEIPALTTNVGTFAEEQKLLSQIANQNSTLSIDQYKQLIDYSSDYADCLSIEGDRITLHEESVAKLTESREKEIQAKIEEGKANKYLEYHKLNQELSSMKTIAHQSPTGTYHVLSVLGMI